MGAIIGGGGGGGPPLVDGGGGGGGGPAFPPGGGGGGGGGGIGPTSVSSLETKLIEKMMSLFVRKERNTKDMLFEGNKSFEYLHLYQASLSLHCHTGLLFIFTSGLSSSLCTKSTTSNLSCEIRWPIRSRGEIG